MNITRDFLIYRGEVYPLVIIELSERECSRHFEYRFRMFADEDLHRAIEEGGENYDDTPDKDIEYYMDGDVRDWFFHRISDAVMKIRIARVILSR